MCARYRCPTGAPASEVEQDSAKFSFVNDYPIPADVVGTIILAVDGDAPGQVLMRELSLRLGRHRCRFVTYPTGCKDLNDVLTQYDEGMVVEVLAGAQPLPIKGLYTLDNLPQHPERVPYPSAVPGLDDHYKLRFGEFTVVTGIPSHGKTTFVIDLACRIVDAYGWMVAVASFELPPSTELVPTLRHWRSGRPWDEVGVADRQATEQWIADHFTFIADETSEVEELADLGWLKERIEAAVIRYNAKLVIVDPWNEIDHDRYRDEDADGIHRAGNQGTQAACLAARYPPDHGRPSGQDAAAREER